MRTTWEIRKNGFSEATASRIRFVPVATAEMTTVSSAPFPDRNIRFVDRLPGLLSVGRRAVGAVPSLPKQRRADSVPEIEYELQSGDRITTTICGRVCRSLADHCGESNVHGREVGGILVGICHEQREEQCRDLSLSVTDLIPIPSFDSSSAHVNFTEDDWTKAERELQLKYAPSGKHQVGWYHTHPQQGIFFSIQDRRAHEIFPQPYHFALVIDPRRMEAGLFFWSSYEQKVIGGPVFFALRRGGK